MKRKPEVSCLPTVDHSNACIGLDEAPCAGSGVRAWYACPLALSEHLASVSYIVNAEFVPVNGLGTQTYEYDTAGWVGWSQEFRSQLCSRG